MISAQHFPDPTRKRLREEDLEGSQPCGFNEHRTKRLALPVRTSPIAQKRAIPTFPLNSAAQQTITPVGSDEGQPSSHFSPWSSSPTFATSPAFHNDHDVDMVMDATVSPAQYSQSNPVCEHVQQNNFGQNAADAAGRMPTPIHPSFAAQARGNNALSGPGPAVAPGQQRNGVNNMGHVHTGAFHDRTVPRTMQAADVWASDVSRRIPSPIAESDSQNGMASPDMCVDGDNDAPFPRGQDTGMADAYYWPPPSFPNNHPRQPGNYESYVPDDSMSALTETTSAPLTPSPGRSRGHMRSKHTVNNWTWQPGMKKSFSIGYRADCDKCRDRVPGHFNHIVIS